MRCSSLGATFPDFAAHVRAAGRGRSGQAPDRHRVGWGGNPDKDAIYLNVTPAKNDGKTVYRLNVKDVPVDGFWSISVYNAQGYFEKNAYDAYSLNNITAKKSADGSVAIQFGGCDGKIAQLPADHEGLELHGAPLSPAPRNPEWHVSSRRRSRFQFTVFVSSSPNADGRCYLYPATRTRVSGGCATARGYGLCGEVGAVREAAEMRRGKALSDQ